MADTVNSAHVEAARGATVLIDRAVDLENADMHKPLKAEFMFHDAIALPPVPSTYTEAC